MVHSRGHYQHRAGYRYDPAGNLILLSYPAGGQTVARSYDALNRLTGVKDWLGHTTTFGYDDNSNPSGVTYPTTNGLTAVYGHDSADGLTSIADSTLGGGVRTPLWGYTYTLDHTERVGRPATRCSRGPCSTPTPATCRTS